MHVVVVGGGIVGFASAYYLCRRDIDVTLVERSTIGGGSTGRANGGIRAQFTTEESIRLSQESIAVWEDFEETFGVDIDYRRPGYLFVARTHDTADQLRANVAVQNDNGVPSEFLTPDEARAHCPGLRTDHYVGTTFCPTDGFADPHLALQGFARAAVDVGTDVHTGVEVTDVLRSDGDSVDGVETTDGRIGADSVVNAAGAWAAEIAAMAGLRLPISPRRRQLMVVSPERPVPGDVPLTSDLDDDVHFRPERAGQAVVGGHFASEDPEADPNRYKRTFDFEWAAAALEHAATCADYFGPESRIRDGWAGLYAVTPDHHPIIEETVPGFVNAVGFSGHGFMQSPATGQLVAELVVDGAASLVDVSRLTADRFDRGETLHEATVID